MQKKNLAAAALLLAGGIGAAQAQDVRVGVTISGEIRPGVYGRVDIGNAPPPPVFYPQPVLVVRQPVAAVAPVYMHVPPGHAKNWSKHCRKYAACGTPVYFVKSAEYEPGYRHPGKGHAKGHGKGSGKDGW
mgnify:CR=1 FL=1